MPLQAYEEFAQDPLVFPIRGKNYVLPELGIEAGLKLAGVISDRDRSMNDKPVEDLWRLVLGTLYDELLADDVPMNAVGRVALTALADHQYGREAAEKAWEAGPEGLTAPQVPNRATRRSNNTAGAKKTPSRASTNGTKPLKS